MHCKLYNAIKDRIRNFAYDINNNSEDNINSMIKNELYSEYGYDDKGYITWKTPDKNYIFKVSREDAISIMKKLKDKFKEDVFFRVLYNSICKGKNDIMINSYGELICEAGNLFIFVKSDGNIYPCIYSEQIIGNINEGLFLFNLNRLKSCPCCTECSIYPMLNFSKNKNKKYE